MLFTILIALESGGGAGRPWRRGRRDIFGLSKVLASTASIVLTVSFSYDAAIRISLEDRGFYMRLSKKMNGKDRL